jgi:hypothetical protein
MKICRGPVARLDEFCRSTRTWCGLGDWLRQLRCELVVCDIAPWG